MCFDFFLTDSCEISLITHVLQKDNKLSKQNKGVILCFLKMVDKLHYFFWYHTYIIPISRKFKLSLFYTFHQQEEGT